MAGKGAGGKQSQLQLKLASVQHCGTWQTDDNDNNCNETEISSGHTGSTRHTDDDVARGCFTVPGSGSPLSTTGPPLTQANRLLICCAIVVGRRGQIVGNGVLRRTRDDYRGHGLQSAGSIINGA